MAQRKRRREPSVCEELDNSQSNCKKFKCQEPLSLLDLSAQCVAANIPFQRVEENISRIPEPVQLRIGYWSFPRNEKEICMYSSLHASVCHSDLKKLPFQRGLWLLEKNAVKDVLQVGFHLSGKVVEEDGGSPCNQTEEYKVSINFDRCKITSVSCSCGSKDILWCSHVVALSLYRIRNPENVTLRVPISETLIQMNRVQLQKLIQYLITEHQTEVLPTAQRLADEILQTKSEINRLPGAPDPTAGASVDDDNCWHLDAEQVREQVRNYLSQGGHCNSGKQLLSMFAKVREMLRVKDKNGSRMLTLITEQFLADPRLQLWKEQGTSMNDKCRQLWDQLGALWVCVVLNPDSNQSDKISWRQQLEAWGELEVCPMENPDKRRAQEEGNEEELSVEGLRDDGPRRTVFSRAISACCLDWNDAKLERILKGNEEKAHLTWTEDVPVAAARVDALRAHGYVEEALRLAVAIARGMKEEQLHKFHKIESLLEKCSEEELEEQLYEEIDEDEYVEGWIGHPLDPIVTLYDTLIEESQLEEEFNTDFDVDSPKAPTKHRDLRTYVHIPVRGAKEDTESYLTLALEVALLGLGQQRTMPVGFYAQDKACRQEEHLIAQLNLLTFDDRLLSVLCEQIEVLLGSGPFSGLGLGVHPTSIPMHTFARFLYSILLSRDPKLAFRVGLRAMRFVVLDSAVDLVGEERGLDMRTRATRWFTLGHLESQQCELASRLLTSAKGQADQLQSVLRSAQRHIHSPSQLFRLAQDALKLANVNALSDNKCDHEMLQVAMELGLQVLRMTLEPGNWRRREMVQWLVECAVEAGTSALSHIMKNWSSLFTATEATTVVAATVMAPSTAGRLLLTPREKEALLCCARALALQCASRNPQLCALSAMTICEKDTVAFEAAYRLVVEAAGNVQPTQLFAIARYMEHNGHHQRAFKLANLAMKHFTLAYNQDTHPSIGDVHWACALAHSLGQDQLGQIIPLVIRAIHCPTVLSDLLYRCTFTPTAGCNRGFRCSKYLGCDKEPLRQLLEATINAYVNTTHSRLNHISPRHYTDFIDFLMKAQESFQLAPEGERRFSALVNNMKILYRGKKKLMQLVKEQFG